VNDCVLGVNHIAIAVIDHLHMTIASAVSTGGSRNKTHLGIDTSQSAEIALREFVFELLRWNFGVEIGK